MRIPTIYTTSRLQEHLELELDEQAAQHLVNVLRLKEGDELRLFNGSGAFFSATLIRASKRSAQVRTGNSETPASESKLYSHLGQVISRGDRMDYVIQKSTEMGVSEITPLLSERCEVKLNSEREDKRLKHWQQVAISAAEQCGRACVPTINPIVVLPTWLSHCKNQGLSLVLHHRDTQRLTGIQPPPSQVNLLIGPEGGLSESEIELALSAGFLATTFGPRVMRTETTPIAALSIVQWLWGDLQSH